MGLLSSPRMVWRTRNVSSVCRSRMHQIRAGFSGVRTRAIAPHLKLSGSTIRILVVCNQGTGMWYPAGKGERPGYSQYASKEQSQQELYDRMQKHYDFSVVDKVAVPANAKPGRYVLSWRWDAEQSPQVWGNCAVVEIQNMKPGKQQKLRGSHV